MKKLQKDKVIGNYANILNFGLKIKKMSKSDIEKKVKDALRMVQLPGYEKREISEMSGGQRQRVAIARVSK
ncbi:hypothetical protein EfmAA290_06500 [Enterococcus faecium]|nr:hypothetical protein EfmAA290_06500 [Enterococcus faecium]